MSIIQRYKNWKLTRQYKKYMKENPHQMFWGTMKVDENRRPYIDESCSFGPWTFEQIDITGNKEIPRE